MRYYLDTEFDGAGGPLLSLALVREDGESIYLIRDFEPMTVWVRRNVRPVMFDCPTTPIISTDAGDLAAKAAEFLASDPGPLIVADWLADIAQVCTLLTTRSLYWSDPDGDLRGMPPLRFACGNVDAYPTTLPGAVQHNAWWDAMALRHALTAREEG
jgi:hypothetical protein